MDFGRKQLEKYGWKDGRGLGKKENGISKAIRPKLKFDNHGVGFNLGDEYKNNWWELMYNKAASSISVGNGGSSSSKPSKNNTNEKQSTSADIYRSFVKTSKLTENGIEDLEMKTEETANTSEHTFFKVLTDDQLFLACGGRTAHKGARHGIKQSGKLSRIEKQEKMLLRKLKNVSLSDDEYVLKKKVKKLSKQKEMCQPKADNDDEVDSLSSCSSSTSHKKNRKKSHRRVSFNELVTEYHNPQPKERPKHVNEVPKVPVIVEARIRDDNDNEINQANNQPEQDEGIEQDIEESERCVRFEGRDVSSLDNLSKKERKLLKKKRKSDGATARFLEELKIKQDVEENPSGRSKKRKLKYDLLKHDEVVTKKFHCAVEEPRVDTDKCEANAEAVQKRMKAKKHKKKAEKRQAKQINSIVESLNQVCKISESAQ